MQARVKASASRCHRERQPLSLRASAAVIASVAKQSPGECAQAIAALSMTGAGVRNDIIAALAMTAAGVAMTPLLRSQ
jgi:hypothetical protein